MFAYCKNNAVNMTDDNGLWPKWGNTALKIGIATAVVVGITAAVICSGGIGAVAAPALVSAAVGGTLSAVSDVIVQKAQGNSKIDYGQTAIAFAGGYASGIFACVSNGGVAAQIAINAVLGAATTTTNALCDGREPTSKELYTSIKAGAFGGLVGGKGAGSGGVLGRSLAIGAGTGLAKGTLAATGYSLWSIPTTSQQIMSAPCECGPSKRISY